MSPPQQSQWNAQMAGPLPQQSLWNSQPQQMAGILLQPGHLNSPPQSVVASPIPNNWSSELCDCFQNMDICCKTFLCPCLTFAQNFQKSFQSYPFSSNSFKCLACFGFALNSCHCTTFISASKVRGRIRQIYSISGGSCQDCISTLPCCCWCALCQEAREFKAREQYVGMPNQVFPMAQPAMPLHN